MGLKKILLTGLVFYFLGYVGVQAQNWQRVVEGEGNFSIELPGEFRKSSNEHQDPVFGKQTFNQFFYTDTFSTSGILVYSLFYTDYPADLVHQDSLDLLEDFFVATAESAAYSMAGNLIYSNELNNRNCPGYTWRIHYNRGDAAIRSRTYLCCSRLYIISVAGSTSNAATDPIFRYLDSFSVLSPCLP